MKIAIIGLGGIGSTFAFQLAQAGHAVTVVARGKRLEQLQRDEALVSVTGKRAAVRVSNSQFKKGSQGEALSSSC